MLENFRSPYDATVVRKLEAAGAVIVGKTNLDEFAMGSSTENSALPRHAQPVGHRPASPAAPPAAAPRRWRRACAAASLGSDTGGSIRQPAALCGLVGLKPTYGRVSRYGLVAFASSLDQIGPFGRTVADAALLLNVIAGHDPQGQHQRRRRAVPDYLADLDQPVEGPAHRHRQGVRPRRRHRPAGEGRGRRRGRRRTSRWAPRSSTSRCRTPKYGIAAYYVIAPCEASQQPRPLRRRPLRPPHEGAGQGHRRAVQQEPRRRLRRRGAAPDHDRHVRAVRAATTTRTTSQRPEGPRA